MSAPANSLEVSGGALEEWQKTAKEDGSGSSTDGSRWQPEWEWENCR